MSRVTKRKWRPKRQVLIKHILVKRIYCVNKRKAPIGGSFKTCIAERSNFCNNSVLRVFRKARRR